MSSKNSEKVVQKRSVIVNGRKSSVSLEDEFWDGLREIVALRGGSTRDLVNEINAARVNSNLSAALRLFVLDHFRQKAKADTALLPYPVRQNVGV